MEIPLQITFRNMPPSEAIENNIREKTAKLKSFDNRIISCRVVVEAPHRHRHKGKAYQVRIDLTVPGSELVINRAAAIGSRQVKWFGAIGKSAGGEPQAKQTRRP